MLDLELYLQHPLPCTYHDGPEDLGPVAQVDGFTREANAGESARRGGVRHALQRPLVHVGAGAVRQNEAVPVPLPLGTVDARLDLLVLVGHLEPSVS